MSCQLKLRITENLNEHVHIFSITNIIFHPTVYFPIKLYRILPNSIVFMQFQSNIKESK